MTTRRFAILAALSAGLAWSCISIGRPAPELTKPAIPPSVVVPAPEREASAPRAASDDYSSESLVQAIEASLRYFETRPPTTPISVGGVTCNVFQYRLALEVLRGAAERGEALQPYVRNYFRVFRAAAPPEGALFTGYYEPILEARRTPGDGFIHPLYRRPDDLLEVALDEFEPSTNGSKIFGRATSGRLAPYHSRQQIDVEGVLDGKQLEIAWVDDPVERFFLHIQGSGILRFEDGSTQRISYAASNGRRYTSIGKRLLDSGELPRGEASAPGIKRHLRNHPELLDSTLAANQRYIFFREVEDGPIGAIGQPLTPGRSVAADLSRHPAGTLAFVKTQIPVIGEDGEFTGSRPIGRFALIQDTGAAITGNGRFDLFFGSGEQNGLEAGHMHARGELLLLIPDCPEKR